MKNIIGKAYLAIQQSCGDIQIFNFLQFCNFLQNLKIAMDAPIQARVRGNDW